MPKKKRAATLLQAKECASRSMTRHGNHVEEEVASATGMGSS